MLFKIHLKIIKNRIKNNKYINIIEKILFFVYNLIVNIINIIIRGELKMSKTDRTTDYTDKAGLSLQKRLKWDRRFMEVAKVVSSWSTCIRNGRQVGAVIVRDKRIIATGYNGAPSGVLSCVERGECLRDKLNIASGTRQEMCYATHAEQNALVQAAKLGVSVEGATIYVTHRPCTICTKLIINAGIKRIVYGFNYPDEFSIKLLNEAGIEIEYLPFDKGE